jgi:CBS domain-containing protein
VPSTAALRFRCGRDERTAVTIADLLAETPVSDLDLSRYVKVDHDVTVSETVRAMCAGRQTCACIVDGSDLVGVFTERDVLQRVVGRSRIWENPIAEEMSGSVRTMNADESVAVGLTVMTDWWVRNVPVLDGDGGLVGNLSYYEVMRTMARVVGSRSGIERRGPTVQHGLGYVDFTGLNTSTPVTVRVDDTVDIAAHHMKVRAIGSVLVVDERENLVGTVTEFDILMKVGCDRADLTTLQVGDVMTPDPVAISARSPIVDALQQMAENGFSHIPLLGKSGRPTAVASFRELATYFESSLETLV